MISLKRRNDDNMYEILKRNKKTITKRVNWWHNLFVKYEAINDDDDDSDIDVDDLDKLYDTTHSSGRKPNKASEKKIEAAQTTLDEKQDYKLNLQCHVKMDINFEIGSKLFSNQSKLESFTPRTRPVLFRAAKASSPFAKDCLSVVKFEEDDKSKIIYNGRTRPMLHRAAKNFNSFDVDTDLDNIVKTEDLQGTRPNLYRSCRKSSGINDNCKTKFEDSGIINDIDISTSKIHRNKLDNLTVENEDDLDVQVVKVKENIIVVDDEDKLHEKSKKTNQINNSSQRENSKKFPKRNIRSLSLSNKENRLKHRGIIQKSKTKTNLEVTQSCKKNFINLNNTIASIDNTVQYSQRGRPYVFSNKLQENNMFVKLLSKKELKEQHPELFKKQNKKQKAFVNDNMKPIKSINITNERVLEKADKKLNKSTSDIINNKRSANFVDKNISKVFKKPNKNSNLNKSMPNPIVNNKQESISNNVQNINIIKEKLFKQQGKKLNKSTSDMGINNKQSCVKNDEHGKTNFKGKNIRKQDKSVIDKNTLQEKYPQIYNKCSTKLNKLKSDIDINNKQPSVKNDIQNKSSFKETNIKKQDTKFNKSTTDIVVNNKLTSSSTNNGTCNNNTKVSPPALDILKIDTAVLIEEQLKSDIGYKAYRRFCSLIQKNQEAFEIWNTAVKEELKKLLPVVPMDKLQQYLKENIVMWNQNNGNKCA